jgi:putative chitinase
MLIDTTSLMGIAKSIDLSFANQISDLLNTICPKYQINTVDRFRMFLANLCVECNEFKVKTENLNYSAQALVNTWPHHFENLDFAKQYEHNPQKLAMYIYGTTSIAKSLGNLSAEDGWTFRGAGDIQITGRGMITAYANYIGNKDAVAVANLIRNDDKAALDSACWFFSIAKRLNKIADLGTDDAFISVVKGINGGTNGLKDRENYYALCKQLINF